MAFLSFHWIQSTVLRVGVILLLSYLGSLLVIGLRENDYLYVPAKYPEDWQEPPSGEKENVILRLETGEEIHGWWCPAGESSPVILFLHGNAGNLSSRYAMIQYLRNLESRPSVFIVDYPGYGKSAGTPSETNLYATGDAAFEYLVNVRSIPPREIIVLGRSLGCAVALHTSIQNPECAGLILECPFLSIPRMAEVYYWYLPGLKFFSRQKFDNEGRIGRLRVPLLLIHGAKDTVVPVAQGRRLFQLAPEPKKYLEVPDAYHGDIYLAGGSAYRKELERFIGEHAVLKKDAR